MPSQVFTATGVATASVGYVHNGTTWVATNKYARDATTWATTYTPAALPLAVASTTTAGQGNNIATVNITMPTGLVNGDLLLIAVNTRANAGTVSAPGWTAHPAGAVSNSAAITIAYLSRPITSSADATAMSGSVVTVTSSTANRKALRAMRITGAAGVDVVGGGAGDISGTTRTIGPVTTTGPGRLLIAAWGGSDATLTVTKDAAMTEVGSQISSGSVATNQQSLVVATQIVAAAGSTGTRAATISATTISAGQLIAITPA